MICGIAIAKHFSYIGFVIRPVTRGGAGGTQGGRSPP